jgi:hypothetical protein
VVVLEVSCRGGCCVAGATTVVDARGNPRKLVNARKEDRIDEIPTDILGALDFMVDKLVFRQRTSQEECCQGIER